MPIHPLGVLMRVSTLTNAKGEPLTFAEDGATVVRKVVVAYRSKEAEEMRFKSSSKIWRGLRRRFTKMTDDWTEVDELFASLYQAVDLNEMMKRGKRIIKNSSDLDDFKLYCQAMMSLRNKDLSQAEAYLRDAVVSRNQWVRYYSRIILDSIALHRAFKATGGEPS